MRGYLLLRELGVPTLPLYGHTDRAVLLEDLEDSETWRLAAEDDVARPEVGRAVARWYRAFHAAGEALLARGPAPAYLTRETDALDAPSILASAQALGLADHPVSALATEHIALLKGAVAQMRTTLNYNDFHWTNLALSRGAVGQPEALVFDYHLLGIGMRCSDCRNVAGSLTGPAVDAFREAYGPVDPREEVLDRPLAMLYGLWAASHLAHWPAWGESCRHEALDGTLWHDLQAAVELAGALTADTF